MMRKNCLPVGMSIATLLTTLIIVVFWIVITIKDGTVITANCQVIGYSVQSNDGYLNICLNDYCQEALIISGWQYGSSSLQTYLESTYPVNSTILCYEYSKTHDLFLQERPDMWFIISLSVIGFMTLVMGIMILVCMIGRYIINHQIGGPGQVLE